MKPAELEEKFAGQTDKDIARYCHGLVEAIARKRTARKLLLNAAAGLLLVLNYKGGKK